MAPASDLTARVLGWPPRNRLQPSPQPIPSGDLYHSPAVGQALGESTLGTVQGGGSGAKTDSIYFLPTAINTSTSGGCDFTR